MSAKQPHLLIVLAAVAGGLILSLNMGVRQSLGLYLEPMTLANAWSRSEFAMGLAVQNLVWGVFTPFAGALADRFGSLKVLFIGAVLFCAGLVVMALAVTPVGDIGGVGRSEERRVGKEWRSWGGQWRCTKAGRRSMRQTTSQHLRGVKHGALNQSLSPLRRGQRYTTRRTRRY